MKNLNFFKTSPFNKSLEFLNQALPVFFLIGSLFEIYYVFSFSIEQKKTFNFFAQIVFLNVIHVSFTYFFLLVVPEFRDYVSQKSIELNYSLKKHWLKFFVYTWIIFSLLSALPFIFPSLKKYEFILFLPHIPILLGSGYHIIRQSVGISIMYFLNLKGGDTKTKMSIIKLEKNFIGILVAIIVLHIIIQIALPISLKNYAIGMMIFVLTCYISFVLFKIYRFSFEVFKVRFLFYARYLFFPLAPLSIFSTLGRASIHGVEYLMILEKVVNAKEKKKWRLNWLFFVAVLFYAAVVFYGLKNNAIDLFMDVLHPESVQQLLIGALINSITFLHFYIDSFIYKFNDPLVQKNQIKLFGLPPSPS